MCLKEGRGHKRPGRLHGPGLVGEDGGFRSRNWVKEQVEAVWTGGTIHPGSPWSSGARSGLRPPTCSLAAAMRDSRAPPSYQAPRVRSGLPAAAASWLHLLPQAVLQLQISPCPSLSRTDLAAFLPSGPGNYRWGKKRLRLKARTGARSRREQRVLVCVFGGRSS